MKKLIIVVVGLTLVNIIFLAITTIMPNLNPGVYLIYQGWLNMLFIFGGLLPTQQAMYLSETTAVESEAVESIEVLAEPATAEATTEATTEATAEAEATMPTVLAEPATTKATTEATTEATTKATEEQ